MSQLTSCLMVVVILLTLFRVAQHLLLLLLPELQLAVAVAQVPSECVSSDDQTTSL